MEEKSKMDIHREKLQEILAEAGMTGTIRDDLNYDIENCGVEFGKFAWMRKEYLEENYWEKYYSLVCRELFIEHFQNVDKRADEMYSRLYPEYLEKYKNEEVARSAVEEVIISEVVEEEFTMEFPNTQLEIDIENLPF